MDDLNLPIITKSLPDPEPLSMDDYLAMVLWTLENAPPPVDPSTLPENRPVPVPFRLY